MRGPLTPVVEVSSEDEHEGHDIDDDDTSALTGGRDTSTVGTGPEQPSIGDALARALGGRVAAAGPAARAGAVPPPAGKVVAPPPLASSGWQPLAQSSASNSRRTSAALTPTLGATAMPSSPPTGTARAPSGASLVTTQSGGTGMSSTPRRVAGLPASLHAPSVFSMPGRAGAPSVGSDLAAALAQSQRQLPAALVSRIPEPAHHSRDASRDDGAAAEADRAALGAAAEGRDASAFHAIAMPAGSGAGLDDASSVQQASLDHGDEDSEGDGHSVAAAEGGDGGATSVPLAALTFVEFRKLQETGEILGEQIVHRKTKYSAFIIACHNSASKAR
jgi:hypothetical protein